MGNHSIQYPQVFITTTTIYLFIPLLFLLLFIHTRRHRRYTKILQTSPLTTLPPSTPNTRRLRHPNTPIQQRTTTPPRLLRTRKTARYKQRRRLVRRREKRRLRARYAMGRCMCAAKLLSALVTGCGMSALCDFVDGSCLAGVVYR
jgi:hypothetical protein